MAFDFDKLIAQVKKEKEENDKRGSNGERSKYSIVYVGSPGGFVKARLLFNKKSGLVQRKVYRHRVGGKQIPCLQMYGQDCPICKAIKDAEAVDSNAYRTYGAKPRGFCYAQVVDYSNHYINKDYPIDKGSIHILMYPRSVYDKLTEHINNSIDHLDELIGKNKGKLFTFARNNQAGATSYSCDLNPWEDYESFGSEEEFINCIEELPDLNDTIVPRDCTEEMLEQAKAAAETIMAEYFGNNSVSPNATDEEVEEIVRSSNEQHHMNASDIVNSVSQESTTQSNSDKPDCFGKYDELGASDKCSLCPFEVECMTGI